MIYELHDIDPAFAQLHGVNYDTPQKITDDVHVTFREAGHILGVDFPHQLVFDGAKWDAVALHAQGISP